MACRTGILFLQESNERTAREVAADLGAASIQVVNVHLQSGMLSRVMACATQNACAGDPEPDALPPANALVIGGDFNTWNSGLTMS
jgi:endonuclease/exonuclease/phosphatase family metal-dependent hydrolase